MVILFLHPISFDLRCWQGVKHGLDCDFCQRIKYFRTGKDLRNYVKGTMWFTIRTGIFLRVKGSIIKIRARTKGEKQDCPEKPHYWAFSYQLNFKNTISNSSTNLSKWMSLSPVYRDDKCHESNCSHPKDIPKVLTCEYYLIWKKGLCQIKYNYMKYLEMRLPWIRVGT